MRLNDICGNEHAKRALEVALAGGHNMLLIGPHESDARRLATVGQYLDERIGQMAEFRAVSPCPCGYYGDPVRECTCSIEQVADYRTKTWPAPGWADITVEVCIPGWDKTERWARNGFKDGEPDERIVERIEAARERSVEGHMDDTGWSLLRAAIQQLQLSPRQVASAWSVAKTIARLAGDETIKCPHMAEALQYRQRRRW